MDIYFWIINSLGFLTIFLVATIFLKPKITVKNVILGLLAIAVQLVILLLILTLIPEVFDGYYWNIINILLLAPSLLMLYKYSRDFLFSIYCLVLALIINNTAFLTVYIQVHLFRIDDSTRGVRFLIILLLTLLEIVIALLVRKGFVRFTFFLQNRIFMRNFSILVVSIGFVLSFIIPNIPSVGVFGSEVVFMMLIIPVLIILAFWQLRMFYKKESEAYKEQYIREVETQQFAIRSFRHDYINLLLTMDQYLKQGDLDGLQQYFDNEIMPTRVQLENQDFELGNLGQLRNKEIKSLLSVKIMEAQSLGISTVVEIPDVVEEITMKTTNLARVLGIFLDNAIEECKKHKDAKLLVAIINKDDCQLIVVKNTCDDEVPAVREIFEKGFSTKGEMRGLGLFNVRQLLDKERHVSLATVIDEGYFIQELQISTEE